jgi:hypothetical protein
VTIREVATRLGRAVGRTWLRWTVWLAPPGDDALITGSSTLDAGAVHDWIREYLGRPNADLGRKGPVCPFAVPALNGNDLRVSFDEEIDGSSPWRMRRAILRYADAYKRTARASQQPESTALLVVFPRMKPEYFGRLDETHAEMKTLLMKGDVMVSAVHPESSRPGVWNAGFRPLRAPFAAFVFRAMDVRDIVFVARNRDAFAHYATRFGHLYESGSVSDEFGYATVFADARKRFG